MGFLTGTGASAFADNFMKTYTTMNADSRAAKNEETMNQIRQQQIDEYNRKKAIYAEIEAQQANRPTFIDPNGGYTEAGQQRADGLMGRVLPGTQQSVENEDIMGESYVPSPEMQDPNQQAIKAITPEGMTQEMLQAPQLKTMQQSQSYGEARATVDPMIQQEIVRMQVEANKDFQLEKQLPLLMKLDPEKGIQLQMQLEDKKQARAENMQLAREKMEETRLNNQANREMRMEIAQGNQDLRREIHGSRGGRGRSGDSASSGGSVLTSGVSYDSKDPVFKTAGIREVRDRKTKVLIGYEKDGQRVSIEDFKSSQAQAQKYDGQSDKYVDKSKDIMRQVNNGTMKPEVAWKTLNEYGYQAYQLDSDPYFRKISGTGKGTQQTTQSQASEIRTGTDGKQYRKVAGGWERI